jgi:hypothetical protein
VPRRRRSIIVRSRWRLYAVLRSGQCAHRQCGDNTREEDHVVAVPATHTSLLDRRFGGCNCASWSRGLSLPYLPEQEFDASSRRAKKYPHGTVDRGPHGWRIEMQDVTLLAPMECCFPRLLSTDLQRRSERHTSSCTATRASLRSHWRRSRRQCLTAATLFRSTPGEMHCARNNEDYTWKTEGKITAIAIPHGKSYLIC